MSTLSLSSNPIWRAKAIADQPNLWVFNKDGFVSAAGNRTLSSQEHFWVDQYNSERASIGAATREAIDNIMKTLSPTGDSEYVDLNNQQLAELTSHVDWLTDHEVGAEFYFHPGNYQYFNPDNPDAEADYRLARMQGLLRDASLFFEIREIVIKVSSGITSPIAIDLNGDGLKTTSLFLDGGVLFDIDGDGVKDRTAWLSGGDAFLAVDKNGNGKIDGVTELFGGTARGDGFASLASYDTNQDGKVDASDEQYSKLLLWDDRNMNGSTDEGELVTASAGGLESIGTNYISQDVYRNGNLLGEVSEAVFRGKTVDAIDVYFRFKDDPIVTLPHSDGSMAESLVSSMSSFSIRASDASAISAFDRLQNAGSIAQY